MLFCVIYGYNIVNTAVWQWDNWVDFRILDILWLNVISSLKMRLLTTKLQIITCIGGECANTSLHYMVSWSPLYAKFWINKAWWVSERQVRTLHLSSYN